MGAALGVKIDFSGPRAEKGDDDDDNDNRRRNSLAFYISQFVPYEEDEYTKLIDGVKADKYSKTAGKPPVFRPSKFGKIADAVANGNMKECRNQTVVFFMNINRHYKDQHYGNTLLHIACQEGYYQMIQFMGDPHNHSTLDTNDLEINEKNDKDRTPLMLCFTPPSATWCGLKYGIGADGNPKSEKPEDIDVISDWIKPGGPKARESCIRFLLEHGAHVNEKDFHDFTALHYATIWGWNSTVRLLLEHGADINAVTVAGKTALMYAVEYHHEGLVIILCNSAGVQLDIADNDGATAFIQAIEMKTEDSVMLSKILLQAGADPNVLTNRRKTALKIACNAQDMEKVDLLLEFKVTRRRSAFQLLNEELLTKINKRLEDDERKANEEIEKMHKEMEAKEKAGYMDQVKKGGVAKSPFGQWVEYIDKKNHQPFYYNTVSRVSQREKPRDFKPDKTRLIKSVVYGMSFYH